jgi:hypothetical protein
VEQLNFQSLTGSVFEDQGLPPFTQRSDSLGPPPLPPFKISARKKGSPSPEAFPDTKKRDLFDLDELVEAAKGKS